MRAEIVIALVVGAVLVGFLAYMAFRPPAAEPTAVAPVEEPRTNRQRIEDAAVDRAVDELLHRGAPQPAGGER